jgi:FemAB-related protein (PEP-CTERM system-associated)
MVSSLDRVHVAPGSSESEWDAFVTRHPHGTVDHLWRWREIFEKVFGHETAYLTAHRGGKVVGVLPLVEFRSRIFGRSVISLPFLNYGGVLADDETVAAELVHRAVENARRFGARHVELRHVHRQFPDRPYRQHKLKLTRPLPASSDELWNDVDRKIRNQVRKAQKAGLVTVVGGTELVSDFYGVFARNMRDLGTPVYSRRLFEETLRQFSDRVTVFVVRRSGVALAAGISVRFRDVALVPWASSLREYRALCPNMLLYWDMLDHAVSNGARVFDFGRSSPGSGTHAFKLQWGASAVPLHWEYVLLKARVLPDQGPSNSRFRTAIGIWKHLPQWVANSMGPAVASHLP